MEELSRLSSGLMHSSALLLQRHGPLLECLFLREGLVHQVVIVTCPVLAAALVQESSAGILEGAEFAAFRFNFDRFSLHVKARKLYQELCSTPPLIPLERQRLAVA